MIKLASTRAARRVSSAALPILLAACARPGAAPLSPAQKFNTWSRYEGEPGATHYSSLKQIDRSNVRTLGVAWSYPIADGSAAGNSPIVVDTVMYVVGKSGSIVALNAATGRELWAYPFEAETRDRGLMYWTSEDHSDRRIIATRGDYAFAIDASTGRLVASFGVGGKTDLREGIDRDHEKVRVTPSSPGVVFENLLIFGSGTGEGYESGPGDIRAFDARTGKLAWVFHTIPHPGEYGYESWPPDAWQRVGGANVWGGMSVDEKRGIVYLPIGSATYDFYGADRLGADVFANSLVALDARTGKRLWHYQVVHHDLWDYDLVTTPTLLTVKHDGKMVDVVAQATKHGFLFVFDRVTGEPLWPIEERPVPRSEMPGEQAWPTQPIPTKPAPFATQSFTEADISPYIADAAERDSIVRVVRGALNQGLFTPPSTRPTVQMPGNHGGANWGLSAADPTTGTFYVLAHDVAAILQLEPSIPTRATPGSTPAERGLYLYQANCQACHGPTLKGLPPYIPALLGVTTRLTAAQIHATVTQGRGSMPAFHNLTDQDIDALLVELANPATAPARVSQAGAPTGGSDPVRYESSYGFAFDSHGLPWNKPPWMTMTAYDLNTGAIRWQIPVGDVDSLVRQGIQTGSAAFLRGGPAVTAGGLMFMATGMKVRAYDKDSGQELWSFPLPGPAEGIPAVYQVGGRQYVAVGAGPGAAGERRAYVVFALPQPAVAR
jgi:quinoprotein glucose dehydrogenase